MSKEKFLAELSKQRPTKINLSIISDTEAIHERLMDNMETFRGYVNELKNLQDNVSDVGEAVRQDWDALTTNLSTLQDKADDIGITADELGLDYIVSQADRFQHTADVIREVQGGVFNITGLHEFR